jgi:two-component sensor histidine kinase
VTLPPAAPSRTLQAAALLGAAVIALPVLFLFVVGPFVMFRTSPFGLRVAFDRAALVYWVTWLPFLPIMVVATRRWPIAAGAPPGAWLAHLGLLALVPLLHTAAFQLAEGVRASTALVIVTFVGTAHYLVMAALMQAARFSRLSRRSDEAAAGLAGELAQARLAALRTQLQPHFLFNTLNSISVLIGDDPPRARDMLGKLSALLRSLLADGDAAEVPLRRELDIVRRYLEIEQIRFESRLSVRVDADPLALDHLVPSMMLQPLVENSVRHAVAARNGGSVSIRAARHEEMLVISVEDDGPGLLAASGDRGGTGIGLANLRARLSRHYGAGHRLELGTATLGGLSVTLAIPARRQEAAVAVA